MKRAILAAILAGAVLGSGGVALAGKNDGDKVDRYYLYRGDSRVIELRFRHCGDMHEDAFAEPLVPVSYYGSRTLGYTAALRCQTP